MADRFSNELCEDTLRENKEHFDAMEAKAPAETFKAGGGMKTRTAHACLASVMAEPIWPDATDDQQGNQRYRAADEAAMHLAAMSAERRAQLEKEWSNG